MNMVCILCMIWFWLGIYENVKWWMWFVVECIGIVENDVYEKGFYIVLNWEGLLWESVTLCLPIPLVPVMYPWVWVVTVLLDVISFDVILGMDWLAQYYASVDCRAKEVNFRIPDVNEFRFRGDKSSMPQNLISAITARKMLRRGCQGYLAVVRDV